MGLFINDVSFFIDLHSIEYTLFYSVQAIKKLTSFMNSPLVTPSLILIDGLEGSYYESSDFFP